MKMRWQSRITEDGVHNVETNKYEWMSRSYRQLRKGRGGGPGRGPIFCEMTHKWTRGRMVGSARTKNKKQRK